MRGAVLAAALLSAAGATDPRGLESIYRAQDGLAPGWMDYGWSPRRLGKGAPLQLDLGDRGGWIAGHAELHEPFASLVVRLKVAAGDERLLEVQLDSQRSRMLPRVPIAGHAAPGEDGWLQVTVPWAVLNPRGLPFDRVVLRASGKLAAPLVLLDDLALVRGPPAPVAALKPAARRDVVVVDCAAPAHRISPMVYGIAYDFQANARDTWLWELNPGARRWGGNAASRYNWRLGNAWNTANDWYFRNVNFTGSATPAWRDFLSEQRAHGVRTALTVPMLGWVAKDTASYSFPVRLFGPQQSVAPELSDAGNGFGPQGKPLPPGSPDRTSEPAPPSFVADWIAALPRRPGQPAVDLVYLDNEPTLWSSTHRDVHPERVSYDELLEKTVAYAAAVRRADPKAVIAGYSAWGFPALFVSGVDAEARLRLRTDRLRHGGQDLLPWFLARVREQEQRTGTKLLDVLDVHFYPQGRDLGVGKKGGTDEATAARRLRSTRALWDPAYRDESWIDEPIRLLPRLREAIAAGLPGLGISIGEYNFGAEEHISGGLAVAEALGRFGEGGVDAAYYWTYPARYSAAYWAFRAFRNYDGLGGHFLEVSVPARTTGPALSAFAARDEGQKSLTVMLLNLDPALARDAVLRLSHCGAAEPGRAFAYAGEQPTSPRGLPEGAPWGLVEEPLPAAEGQPAVRRLAPSSITVLEIPLLQ